MTKNELNANTFENYFGKVRHLLPGRASLYLCDGVYKQFHSMDVMVGETVGKRFSGYAKAISLCNGLSWFLCFVSVTWRDVRRKRGSACFTRQQIHRECGLLLLLNNNNVTISSIS